MTIPADRYVVIGKDGRVVREWNPEKEKWVYRRDWRTIVRRAGQWVGQHEIFGISGFIAGAVVWVYILHCVYEMTPFLQWMDENYPLISIPMWAVIIIAPMYLVDYIHRLKREAKASKV